MERESFEDDYVAQLLNEHFISIKVDREERPDIDHLYMEFCQVLSGSGGWPLTIIMTPEKEPFFAGTYFPRTSQYGRAGLLDILRQTSLIWQEDKERLIKAAIEIAAAVRKYSDSSEPAVIHDQGLEIQPASNHADTEFRHKAAALLDKAYTHLENSFDSHYGGFGQAPKFPSPHTIGFLLRCPGATYSKAPTMARKTLEGMQQGGIYDHIGFGFARYSTDEMWLVPHFEKMLYDNALLAYVYLEASQSLGDKKYLQTAQDIFTYILRDMTSPEGGFYSAEDADSEGVEGKFYLWSPAEIINLLGSESGEMFMNYYGITPHGNYQGKNIPNLLNSSKELHDQGYDLNKEQLAMKLEQCRSILFAAREKRIHPHKDDKILTSWNGLMIAALAKGFFITGDRAYMKAAEKSVNFILSTLRQSDGRLLARYRDHQAAYLAYLDDYSFLIWGLLECYTALGLPYYLKTAIELQNQQEILFRDENGGGYFLTGIDSEKLLFRPKQTSDSALPSGNSVSVFNLLRLARLTSEVRWEQLAYRQLIEYLPKADSNPEGYTMFLQAVQFFLHSGQDLILAGSLNSPQKRKMQEIISQHFLPFATILYQEGSVNSITPWLADYPYNSNEYKCYICENYT
ncbi:MAG TPA: thioredoxin domain-containing protein, partial [Desulfitobacteriaceae bacterium]|nr:thioredoxin domain-containing protein [Desulfitobacteriaceae bacterium]